MSTPPRSAYPRCATRLCFPRRRPRTRLARGGRSQGRVCVPIVEPWTEAHSREPAAPQARWAHTTRAWWSGLVTSCSKRYQRGAEAGTRLSLFEVIFDHMAPHDWRTRRPRGAAKELFRAQVLTYLLTAPQYLRSSLSPLYPPLPSAPFFAAKRRFRRFIVRLPKLLSLFFLKSSRAPLRLGDAARRIAQPPPGRRTRRTVPNSFASTKNAPETEKEAPARDALVQIHSRLLPRRGKYFSLTTFLRLVAHTRLTFIFTISGWDCRSGKRVRRLRHPRGRVQGCQETLAHDGVAGAPGQRR